MYCSKCGNLCDSKGVCTSCGNGQRDIMHSFSGKNLEEAKVVYCSLCFSVFNVFLFSALL